MRPKLKQDPTLPQGFNVNFRKRYWEKVNKNGPVPLHCPELGPCWEWMSFKNYKGYGRISVIRNETAKLASHCAWMLHHGKLPDGWVLHHCDNPGCVNPDHLWTGTDDDNKEDCIKKQRTPRGERNGHAKLTWEKVRSIRAQYAIGNITQRTLAVTFGVGEKAIQKILRGIRWIEWSH